jgi:hypothetical protein
MLVLDGRRVCWSGIKKDRSREDSVNAGTKSRGRKSKVRNNVRIVAKSLFA